MISTLLIGLAYVVQSEVIDCPFFNERKLNIKLSHLNEPRHEKNNILHMRKQRRRSALR